MNARQVESDITRSAANSEPELRRALTLPWLVFYGVGVTIGAGIFALIGEVVGLAGDRAPMAFLFAGLVAGLAGFAYALFARVYPRSAGEAIFVTKGLGASAGRLTGYAVVAVAITSSATIAVAFGGYLSALLPLPPLVSILLLMVFLGFVAWLGVRESVGFASLITLVEVVTLVVIVWVGWPHVSAASVSAGFALPASMGTVTAILSAAFVAFFAFIGFEDIENMAEETRQPERTVPRAIVLTLVISTAVYMLVSLVAVSFPDREAFIASDAPLAVLFGQSTGFSGEPVAAMASIALINGILVQLIMASRVLYGMGKSGLAPSFLSRLSPARQTPAISIVLVSVITAGLAVSVPLLGLARFTSLIMLTIFCAVNVSLLVVGGQPNAPAILAKWRWFGIPGAIVSGSLAAFELAQALPLA